MTTREPDSDSVPPDDTTVIDSPRIGGLDICFDADSRVFTITLAPGVQAQLGMAADDAHEQRRWLVELINHLTVTERSMRWGWVPPAMRTTRG
ncbi:hypothetical protein [Streptomonospora salina]|uniref:Uncharacterized protein n=1 Tax=Streptomonospora salina TaxID=104205 RepID=A0A841EFB4_9ACTN|nr:hypothetical protein [Streptomonospora salina]MBB5999743.1 hypothetical protein [Streptomonospora salina]